MTVFVDKRDPSSRFISVTNSTLDFKCGRLEVAQEATLDCTWLNHLCLRLKVCLLFVLQTNHEVALPSPAPPLRCPSSADGFRLQDLRVQCGKIWLQEGFKFQSVTHSDQGETAAHFAPSLDPCRFISFSWFLSEIVSHVWCRCLCRSCHSVTSRCCRKWWTKGLSHLCWLLSTGTGTAITFPVSLSSVPTFSCTQGRWEGRGRGGDSTPEVSVTHFHSSQRQIVGINL